MTSADTQAQKAQVTRALEERYFPIIPQLQRTWTPEQHQKNRLSRSLAAFAIEKLADVTPTQAANSIVDGENDNGIDAIYFDRLQKRLWLVQTKAGKAPDMGENKKFCDGIRDLIHERFGKFNDSFSRLQPDVEAALDAYNAQIIGCHVYLDGELGTHAIADMTQLEEELNQFSLRFNWQDCNLATVHSWLTAEQVITPPSVTLTLEKWFGVDQPRSAFYGLVTAEQLALLYQEHGKVLFEKNIRYYLGAEQVNRAIAETVQDQPEELFYLNNGITAICSQIKPSLGTHNERGQFMVEGFSIVNGAQTVGSIAATYNIGGTISPAAKVLITLIEIQPTPDKTSDDLGTKITQARNTQNAVRDLYFAALDPIQERLRQELAVSGITYHYRPSADQGGENTITIEQALLALACFKGKTYTVSIAKRSPGQLYRDYKAELFPPKVSGLYVYRAVQIFQYLNTIFAASEQAETANRRKNFYRHGRYFILHILGRQRDCRALIEKPELVLSEADQRDLSRRATDLAELIYTVAESQCDPGRGYLAIFRNSVELGHLASAVAQAMQNSTAQRS